MSLTIITCHNRCFCKVNILYHNFLQKHTYYYNINCKMFPNMNYFICHYYPKFLSNHNYIKTIFVALL